MAFENIITTAFKTTYKDAINALLETTALTVPCQLNFNNTKSSECPNCYFNSVTKRSNGIYKVGGPQSFTNGVCPHCHGLGLKFDSATETVYLIPIWESRQFSKKYPVDIVDMLVQTVGKVSYIPSLNKATSIIIDTTLNSYMNNTYEKYDDPEPFGLGDTQYIINTWKKSG